ncbi:MAG: efflux RND transporter periplasmic adaptor subunit [Roseiarcus sp.]
MSRCWRVILAFVVLAPLAPAWGQQQPPPAVGVVKVERKPVTETSEYLGRIQAINRVDLSARVTAFLEKRLFTEGSEVKQGDLLYQLERGPFEADVQAKQAAIKQVEAQLRNADLTLSRARELLRTTAGTQANVDAAEASQQALAAQLLAAQAQLRQSQINLDYTEIHAPIDGKIGRTATTEGNVVGPSSGVLSTIVSQDPMYVVFSVPSRTALELRQKIVEGGGFDVVKIGVKLPDGRLYGEVGKLDFINNTVSTATDTLLLRGVIANPSIPGAKPAAGPNRELLDGEFVNVLLEGAQPIEALVVPGEAVLTDQSGDYVYVVDAQGKAQRQGVKLGQSTPTSAAISSGLQEGQLVIVEGLQRVRPGQTVSAGPAVATSPAAGPSR